MKMKINNKRIYIWINKYDEFDNEYKNENKNIFLMQYGQIWY